MGAFGSVADIQKAEASNQSHNCEGHADSARPDTGAGEGADNSEKHSHHEKRQQESRDISRMNPPVSLLASKGLHRKNQQSNIRSQYKNHEKPPILFAVSGSRFLEAELRDKKQNGVQHKKKAVAAGEQHPVNTLDPRPGRYESDSGQYERRVETERE